MRLPRLVERLAFGHSPARLIVAPRLLRYHRLGYRPLDDGQVTTRPSTGAVGPVARPSSSASRPVPPSPGALHLVSQTNAALKVDEIVVVAVPERSWRPVKVTAKVTTSLVIEEAS